MKQWLLVFVAAAAGVPGAILVVAGEEGMAPLAVAMLLSMAILGAAFLLSWGAEVVQKDISQALAMTLLALICVLPEYSVDFYFAAAAAHKPGYAAYALANMTGANRLLIGFGWPLVVGVFWLTMRRRSVLLDPGHRLELAFLGVATAYSFTIPLRGTLSLWDAGVLIGLFIWYAWRAAKSHMAEPDLVGPARSIGGLRPALRRGVTALLFVFAAGVILLVAEPFAESLVSTGKGLGIDEFLLVQWVAPLASEAPEIVVAVLFVLRGQAMVALGTLVSSKVNQWTLLVGSLPVVYTVSGGDPGGLPLDGRQGHELLLTAAQSAFALALMVDLRLSVWGAGGLFGLFALQAALPETRLMVAALYLVLALGLMVYQRSYVRQMLAPILGLGSAAKPPGEKDKIF